MQFKYFRIGMRTIKTALSVMLCIMLYHFMGRGSSMIACLSAVFALRENMESTYSFGKSRVLGNTIGGSLAIFYIAVQSYFGHKFIIELLLIPLSIIFLIVLSDAINNNKGIIGGSATLLLIVFTVSADQSVGVAFLRFIDSLVGTFIAIGVNYVIKNPTPNKNNIITLPGKTPLTVLKRNKKTNNKEDTQSDTDNT